jgi:uncharacterized protein
MAFLWAVLALFLLAAPARAQDFPPFTGLVVDAANVLPPDREAALTAKLQGFQQKTGKQLVVATVPSLGGGEIQDYGYKLGRAWGVGLKGADNGTILLVAPNDRKVGIETGRGVSGMLTDAYTSVVINSKILPAFKAGDLPGGIEAGTDALIDILSTPDEQAQAKEQAAIAEWNKTHQRGHDEGVPWGVIVWIVIIGFVVIGHVGRRARYGRGYRGGDSGLLPIILWEAASHMGDRDRGGGWGGGSFGGGSDGGGGGWMDGGFTGGGGGSFDGGGSSGSW